MAIIGSGGKNGQGGVGAPLGYNSPLGRPEKQPTEFSTRVGLALLNGSEAGLREIEAQRNEETRGKENR